jgi:predicted transcriptional regulator
MKRARTDVNLMFRAFSDRTRLRILRLLLGGELCVGDIVSAIRVPQPTASRHLAYLRKAAWFKHGRMACGTTIGWIRQRPGFSGI